jgi:hypothetical protein
MKPLGIRFENFACFDADTRVAQEAPFLNVVELLRSNAAYRRSEHRRFEDDSALCLKFRAAQLPVLARDAVHFEEVRRAGVPAGAVHAAD